MTKKIDNLDIVKTTRETIDIDWNVEAQNIFVETKTEVKTIEYTADYLESRISQLENTIENATLEKAELESKFNYIKSL